MKYGKIRNGEVYITIETDNSPRGYSGSIFYNTNGSVKSASVIIAEQNLKPIQEADHGEDKYPINYYTFEEKASSIEVSNILTDEARLKVEESALAKIRQTRKTECFSVVNRGKVWYENLTESQYNELETWYQEWLDAPQTGYIPVKPEFLK